MRKTFGSFGRSIVVILSATNCSIPAAPDGATDSTPSGDAVSWTPDVSVFDAPDTDGSSMDAGADVARSDAVARDDGLDAAVDATAGDGSVPSCVGPSCPPRTWAECLARAGATTATVTGTQDRYRNGSPPADWNLDLTRATFSGYPDVTVNPVLVGNTDPAARACIGGGIVIGQQARDLTWLHLHDVIGGGGYRITTAAGEWSRIDGIRTDNVEDGLKPRGPDGHWELWNAYMTYNRDDCVENDELAPGSVHDSLFDGCYVGFSEQNDTGCCDAAPGETFVVDRVLVRLQLMPGPYGTPDPTVFGHGKFFKWQAPVPHPVVINDSIFLAEGEPSSATNWPFPLGTVTTDVTVVYLGPGAWRWPVPAGTTVTTDRGVWDRARQRWLDRHGCTSFDQCTRLSNPDPW